MSDGDEVGKIFVGGLTRETTDDMLRQYFAKYGEIVECIVMRDKMTQVSRGFGFVKYSDPNSVQEVLKGKPHSLDNKKIDPKPCTPKTIQQQKKNAAMEHTQTHKIFIGGLAQSATEDEVKNYFCQYGTVNEVVFVINKEENRHKGFGFVTFEDESAVDAAVERHFHEICGKRVEAKRATPREKMRDRNQGMDGNDGYSGAAGGYGYGYQGGQGGWGMPPSGNGGMMGGYGYGGYGQGGYGGGYPPSYGQPAGYYGYNYNAGPGMMYGQGPPGNKGDASGYGGMGNYQQQTQGGYGPTRGSGQSYGGDYGNGYGRGNDGGGGGAGRGSGQGYHPYKR